MNPDWVFVVAPATTLLGVVLGSLLTARLSARVTRANWRRDALLQLHTETVAVITDTTLDPADPLALFDFGRTLFRLVSRANLLQSQSAEILEELLQDSGAANEEFQENPGEALRKFAAQLSITYKQLIEVMQDEMQRTNLSVKKNKAANKKIKQKMIDSDDPAN